MEDKGTRKFHIALLAMALIFVGFLLTKPWNDASKYDAFCMAELAAAGIFAGANVMDKRSKQAGPPAV